MRGPLSALPAFLAELGPRLKELGITDPQMWAQRRTSKGKKASVEIWGTIIDIDESAVDVLAAVEAAGVPHPNAYFHTKNGFKLVYVFKRPATPEEFTQRTRELTLAFSGGDPRSWEVSQGQRLPACTRTTDVGVEDISFPCHIGNGTPFSPAITDGYMPDRLHQRLANNRVSADLRGQLVDALEEQGIAVPEHSGSVLGPKCLRSDHDTNCCYTRRAEDGRVSLKCLGGHDGAGALFWSEADIAQEFGIGTAVAREGTDITRHLPWTWATEELIRHTLRDWSKDHVTAAVAVVRNRKACLESTRTGIGVELFQGVYATRVKGHGAVGPVRLHFAEHLGGLAVLDNQQKVSGVRLKGDSLSPRNHRLLLQSSAAWAPHPEAGQIVVGPTPEAASLFNLGLGGHQGALATLGIPVVRSFNFPVAHVQDGWSVEPGSRLIRSVRTYNWIKPGLQAVDPVQFFMRLFQQGRLPVASSNDVLRFLMALATPLLRHIGQGQLGVYWMHGPVGAGKDLMAELLSRVYEKAVDGGQLARFELGLTSELEMKRTIFAAAGALYARAKEAGKRKAITDLLIRLAGTDLVAARGMNRDEVTVPNLFTVIADSAEDLPDRREISRRTTMIQVAFIDEAISKGDMIREVEENAAGLLLGMKELVESRSPEWYRGQTNTGSRPVIPVALSRLLGVELPVVKGRDLDELFDAMAEYTVKFADSEGETQKNQSRDKDGREAKAFRSFRFSHFVDSMRGQVGYRELFEGHRGNELMIWLQREANYTSVAMGKMPYLPVQLGDKCFAFKIVKNKRNFIFVPEAEYAAAMSVSAVSQAPTTSEIAPSSQTADAGPATFTEAELNGGK